MIEQRITKPRISSFIRTTQTQENIILQDKMAIENANESQVEQR